MERGRHTLYWDNIQNLFNTLIIKRQAAGGSFQAKSGDLPSGDLSPPSRVTDLQVE